MILNINTLISRQVLQELSNTITRKLGFSFNDAIKVVEELTKYNNLHINKHITIIKAYEIAARYQLSFYNSMIIAAVLEGNCKILYSADMQNNQIINSTFLIINLFL